MSTLSTCLFSYSFSEDENNFYLHSEHFNAIVGVDYKDKISIYNYMVQILDASEISWEKEIVDLEFQAPINQATDKIDIYLGNRNAVAKDGVDTSIPPEYAGYATSYPSDAIPYFVLDPRLTTSQLQSTIAHEFFHTIQYNYFDETKIDDEKWEKNIWWLEATATMIEDEVYDDIDDYIYYANIFFQDTRKNFEINDYSHEYSMVIFAKYIKEKYGFQIIKDSLDLIDSSGDDGYFEILDQLLQGDYNTTMNQALVEFAKWINNPDQFFEEGSLYPSVTKFSSSDSLELGKGGIVIVDNLQEGWNMSALPTSNNFNDIQLENQELIWNYENGIWKNNIPSSGYENITTTDINKGYWVKTNSNSSTYYTYNDINRSLDTMTLNDGWNLVGTFQSIDTQEFSSVDLVWYFDGFGWKFYSKDTNLNSIAQSYGYEVLNAIPTLSSFWILK